MQIPRLIRLDEIEVRVLPRLGTGHDHVRALVEKGVQSAVNISGQPQGRRTVQIQKRLDRTGQRLSQDLVFYYRLADDLPGRVEVVPFRDGESGPGTFMMVVTPGLDLQPITNGADYIYVLDFGRLIAEGTPAEIRTNELVIEAYLGQGAEA